MKISIYVDEDSQSSSLIQGLLTRGVDVITARQAGMLERSDIEQLEWPLTDARCLVPTFEIFTACTPPF